MQGKRGALPSSTIMLRQPMQRFQQMQASDIDIYRNELRKTKNEIVSAGALACPSHHVTLCLWACVGMLKLNDRSQSTLEDSSVSCHAGPSAGQAHLKD